MAEVLVVALEQELEELQLEVAVLEVTVKLLALQQLLTLAEEAAVEALVEKQAVTVEVVS